jgi:hypothetical protein
LTATAVVCGTPRPTSIAEMSARRVPATVNQPGISSQKIQPNATPNTTEKKAKGPSLAAGAQALPYEIAREYHHAIVEVGRDQLDACAHESEHQFGAYN